MDLKQAIEYFHKYTGMLKTSKAKLSKKLNCSEEIVTEALKVVRQDLKIQSSYKEHLETIGVKESQVIKTKSWQSMSGGDLRWSVDFKPDSGSIPLEEQLESIRASFKDVIQPIKIDVKEKDNRKALFIYTSDKHVGAKTSSDSLYLNEYNAEVFKERLFHVLEIIHEQHKLHGTFDALYIIDLGDCLDGYNAQTTRGGHALPQNLNNNQQLDTYFEAHKELFDSIVHMNVATRINFIACTNDNHSGNFGYAANRLVEIYLNCKYPDIQCNIIKKFIDYIQYGQHTFIYTHGKDDKDMKFGFPLRLNEKTEKYINTYIHQHRIQTPNIHVVKGDLHQANEENSEIFRYKNILSMYGSSKWIMTNFGTNRAGYAYEIVDKYSSRIIKEDIIFEQPS
jgi:hypothetical protein